MNELGYVTYINIITRENAQKTYADLCYSRNAALCVSVLTVRQSVKGGLETLQVQILANAMLHYQADHKTDADLCHSRNAALCVSVFTVT